MFRIVEETPPPGTLEAHARDMERGDGPSLACWRRDVAVIQHLQACGEIGEYLKVFGWRTVPFWAVAPYTLPAVEPIASPPQSRSLAKLHPALQDFVMEVKQRFPNAFVVETDRTVLRQQWLFGQGRTLESALVEFPKSETQIGRIPAGCWDHRQRKVTWTLRSRHLIQPDGYSHAVDIGLLDGRKGMEHSPIAYQSFVANARQLLLMSADRHGGISDARNGGAKDMLHWQISVRG